MSEAPYLQELHWLNSHPRLEELVERYPAAWEEAGRQLMETLQAGRTEDLNEGIARAKVTAEIWSTRIRKSRNNPKVIESALPQVARSKMFLLALDKCHLAGAAGQATGKARLNLVNGWIIQKLLFHRHLTRKPASLFWFNFWWRFISQKRLLMPLVKKRGIYCFYTKELVRSLAAEIGARPCLEIAAGDGTLARFLKEAGTEVAATDDRSWSYAVEYPEAVEQLDAKQSLSKYQPKVVLCSWPPPGNSFERHVFTTESVEEYIVIGSRYKFASGNWDAYSEQRKFDWEVDERLSNYVLPPELGHAVLVFRKKA